MKNVLIAAAVAVSSAVAAMPAQANIVANANEMCRMITKFNKTHGLAMAPGTAGSKLMSNQKYSGYSYSQLWNLAKKVGTVSDCSRMY